MKTIVKVIFAAFVLSMVPATYASAQTGSERHIETPKERKERLEREAAAKKKKQQEAAAKKKREEEARKKREQEAAAQRQREEQARRQREQEEAARKKREQEEAARKKREQEAAAQRQREEQARRQREQEEAARKKREQEEQARRQREAKKIRGTVIDKKGKEPIIGCTVQVKGTNRGIVTDFDGNFSIEVEPGATLIFRYVGYKTQEVKVGNEKVITVTMKED